MVLYFSDPYIDGPQLEDITGEDFIEATILAEKFRSCRLSDETIYVGF
jgi:hypothetical protein